MGFNTGMRRGEILNLVWSRVDLKNNVIRLRSEDTKDDERRTIPICPDLHAELKKIQKAKPGIGEGRVFTFKGKQLKDIRTGLRKACKAAGIKYGRFEEGGFIFHDLRHTFNTNMRKAGVPESVIMEITGHSTREMFDRYNTIDEADCKQAMDKFAAFVSS